MDAIDPIDEDTKAPMITAVQPIQTPHLGAAMDSAADEDVVRDMLQSASAVLSDSANSLYSKELEDVQGVVDKDDPDDDRAAGRLEHARLDLLSE